MPGHQHKGVERTQEDVHEELQEKLLVVVANAVVDPWTVVVHAGDASLTNRTVMTQGRFHRVALLAVLSDN